MRVQLLRNRRPRAVASAVQLRPRKSAVAQARNIIEVDGQGFGPICRNQADDDPIRERPSVVLVQLAADGAGLALGCESGGRFPRGVLVDRQDSLSWVSLLLRQQSRVLVPYS